MTITNATGQELFATAIQALQKLDRSVANKKGGLDVHTDGLEDYVEGLQWVAHETVPGLLEAFTSIPGTAFSLDSQRWFKIGFVCEATQTWHTAPLVAVKQLGSGKHSDPFRSYKSREAFFGVRKADGQI